MNKEQIQSRLKENHQRFVDVITSLNDSDFVYTANGKWTAGQQLDHIYRAVSAVNNALLLPKFVFLMFIGKANRPSKDYDGLVARYKTRLQEGGRARGRFVPGKIAPAEKTKLAARLLRHVDGLCKKIDGYSEEQLDFYILPHPLLGKVTLKEMLYFTIYHAEHHQKATLANLGR